LSAQNKPVLEVASDGDAIAVSEVAKAEEAALIAD